MPDGLKTRVREYWEKEPCGTGTNITGNYIEGSPEWYQSIEEHRYKVEPFIHSVAQFTRHRGKKILEVGVGAGTDHLQWARAGAECYGVDLTDAAIRMTESHLRIHNLSSHLARMDAEVLPFNNDSFDLVYSWGVIHHSENPEKIIDEIRRVLRPSGVFIGMMYGRHSLVAVRLWVAHALLKGRPFQTLRDVIWNRMESHGTKAYTRAELKLMFRAFRQFDAIPILTTYDTAGWPSWLTRFFPMDWGWFTGITATK